MRACRLLSAVAAACALVGCSGGGDGSAAATLPPVSQTPTPSASPTASVPAEAQEATPEGAAEFAGFYAEEVARAYLAKDAEGIRRLSLPECGTCQRYIGTVEQLIAQDATVAPAYKVEVVDSVAPAGEPTDRVQVTVILRQGEFVVTGPDGRELAREAANDQVVQDMVIVRQGDGWLVAEVTNS
jgi:hypothetical protein